MAITADEKYLLNTKMGSVGAKVQLGTLIENAEDASPAAGSVDTEQLAADAVTGAKIEDDAVSVEHLDDGILPSHVVKYAGKFTTLGGDATETITVTGMLATDVVQVTVQTTGTGNRTIVDAIPTNNTITVTLSGDPSTNHILAYVVHRAVS